MKKILFAIAFILMVVSANAQDGFFRAEEGGSYRAPSGEDPMIPHGAVGSIQDQDAAPLGSGLLILTAMGAGYAATRRKKSR